MDSLKLSSISSCGSLPYLQVIYYHCHLVIRFDASQLNELLFQYCRFFSARKHGLVDAAVRGSSSDRTAVVALPGGIGTLDEVFEILALIQLERIGSELPVPFLLMNYDSFYSKLLDFFNDCEGWGTVSKGEVASLWKVCNSNTEALAYLAEFYSLPLGDKSKHETELQSARGSVSS